MKYIGKDLFRMTNIQNGLNCNAYVTEAPVTTVEDYNKEYNKADYGEDFHACLISKEEFEEIWNTGIYNGDLEF